MDASGALAYCPVPMTPLFEILTTSSAEQPGQGERVERHNALLAALPDADLVRILPAMEHVALPTGMTLHEANAPISHVYFMTSGMVSLVSEMREGTVEVGTVGFEGMVGLPIVLHAESMLTRAFMQVEGAGVRMSAPDLRWAMAESATLDRLLHRYALAVFDLAAQGSACNRLHGLESRCARWLLMTHDRVRADLMPLKQTFLAQMLGVHRPSVTLAAGALQRAGLIRYSRGKVTVLDRGGLEAAACECYAINRRSFERLRRIEGGSPVA